MRTALSCASLVKSDKSNFFLVLTGCSAASGSFPPTMPFIIWRYAVGTSAPFFPDDEGRDDCTDRPPGGANTEGGGTYVTGTKPGCGWLAGSWGVRASHEPRFYPYRCLACGEVSFRGSSYKICFYFVLI